MDIWLDADLAIPCNPILWLDEKSLNAYQISAGNLTEESSALIRSKLFADIFAKHNYHFRNQWVYTRPSAVRASGSCSATDPFNIGLSLYNILMANNVIRYNESPRKCFRILYWRCFIHIFLNSFLFISFLWLTT